MCPNGDKLTIHRQQRSKTLLLLLEGDENKWSFNLRLKDGSASSKLVAFAQISGSAWKNHLHLGFSVWSDCRSIARYNFSLKRYNIARYNFSSYSIASALRTPWWGLQLPLTSGNQTSNHYCRFHSLLVIRYWCWSTLPLVNRRSRVRRIMAKKTCFLVRLPHPLWKPERRHSLINAYHWLSSTHIGDFHVCLHIIDWPIAIFCFQVGKVRPGSFELNAQFQFSWSAFNYWPLRF